MVALHNLLSELLSALVNVLVELVSVLPDGELLIIVDRDVDAHRAIRFFGGVMELRNIGMLENLLSGKSLARIEIK